MQPLVRALKTMGALARANRGLTLQDLSAVVAAPIASVHRLLPTLEEEGFIVRSPSNRRYFIGPSAADIGLGATRRPALIGIAYRHLQELAQTAGHPVIVAEQYGGRAVCTLRLDPTGTRGAGVSSTVQVGEKLPWHASTSARTLLVDLDEQMVWRLLSGWRFHHFTERTPVSVEAVWGHLEEARKHGYGISYDEWEPGIWTLSAPVRDAAQRLVATISVAGPASEVGSSRTRARIRDLALDTAELIGADLGNSEACRQSGQAPLALRMSAARGGWQHADPQEAGVHADTA
ncbi:IclR family transcriptional regulator [Nonomuraea helvata]|uniref:IclR family transcriptional regulator n=1 Tax=Nonomuraea helvata TaxID=37484 RepID=A0ABV5SAH9_9ACTN